MKDTLKQHNFSPRDATTIKPGEVRVGDYFVKALDGYTIIGIDANLLAYVFTGLNMSVPDGEYAQLITTRSGRTWSIRSIDKETLS